MKRIRTLISCISPFLCQGIETKLEEEQDIEIVGKMEDEDEMEKNLRRRPDVIILDPLLYRPEKLFKAIHEIKTKAPRTKLLLLFSEAEMSDVSLMQYMMEGVDGYVRRKAKMTQLAEAVRAVHTGRLWAERKLLDKFVRDSPKLATDFETKLSKLENPLTKREREIVMFLVQGQSNRRISSALNISEKTVKTHLNNIFRKMKVTSRTQVISSLIFNH